MLPFSLKADENSPWTADLTECLISLIWFVTRPVIGGGPTEWTNERWFYNSIPFQCWLLISGPAWVSGGMPLKRY